MMNKYTNIIVDEIKKEKKKKIDCLGGIVSGKITCNGE